MTSSRCQSMLDVLCPMHIVFARNGTILAAGPTARKICPCGLIDRPFLDVFEIKRPKSIHSVAALQEQTGVRLNLRMRNSPHQQLKGVVSHGPGDGEMIVNLSFGISVVDAVPTFGLTAADFAATDLTVEMLYLVEAKSAAMDASKELNKRLQNARMAAELQANTDTLTGLKNRRAVDAEIATSLAAKLPFALMHIDLDYFKAVNDTLGHAAGDFILQTVSDIMNEEIRQGDVAGRVGGDEFVILVNGPFDRAVIDRIALRIIERLKQPIYFGDDRCDISCSVGIATSCENADYTADQLLRDADAALYAAKNAGRGRHVFFDPDLRKDAQSA